MKSNPPTPTVANVLQEARALVAQGWCQGWYISGDGDDHWNYCLVGAFNAAAHGHTHSIYQSDPVVDAAFAALEAQLPRGFQFLDDFNDHPRTTQKRVVALYDRALCEVTK